MIFPVIPQQTAVQPDEGVDLKVAIRLLSGFECERDASQAQKMLLRLAESADPVIASDAARIVKAGAANKWFTEKAPRQYELERIAEKSLARLADRPIRQQRAVMIATLLALFMAGLFGWLAVSGGRVPIAPLIVAILIALAILGPLVGRAFVRR